MGTEVGAVVVGAVLEEDEGDDVEDAADEGTGSGDGAEVHAAAQSINVISPDAVARRQTFDLVLNMRHRTMILPSEVGNLQVDRTTVHDEQPAPGHSFPGDRSDAEGGFVGRPEHDAGMRAGELVSQAGSRQA